jgi:hypothetical protein
MTWTLVSQLALLMVLACGLVIQTHASIIDKRREDAYKRKENGL